MHRQPSYGVRQNENNLPARKIAAAMSDERLSQALHKARRSRRQWPATVANGMQCRAQVHRCTEGLSMIDTCATYMHNMHQSQPRSLSSLSSARVSARRARPPQRQRPLSASASMMQCGMAQTKSTRIVEANTARAATNIMLFARAHALVESTAGDSSGQLRRVRTSSVMDRAGVRIGPDCHPRAQAKSSRLIAQNKQGTTVAVAAVVQGQRGLPRRSSSHCNVDCDERSYQHATHELAETSADDHQNAHVCSVHDFGAWTEENDRATAAISRRRMSAVSGVDRSASARDLHPEASISATKSPLSQDSSPTQVCQVQVQRRNIHFAEADQETLNKTLPDRSSRSSSSSVTKVASRKKKKKKIQARRTKQIVVPPPRSRHGMSFVGGVRIDTNSRNMLMDQRRLKVAVGAAAAVAHDAARAANMYATTAALIAWQSDEHLEQAMRLATEGNLGKREQTYFADVLQQAEIRADDHELERTMAWMRQLSHIQTQVQGDTLTKTQKSGKHQAAKKQNVLKSMAARADAKRRAATANTRRKLKRQIKVTNIIARLSEPADSAPIAMEAECVTTQPPASPVGKLCMGTRVKNTSRRASTTSITLLTAQNNSQRDKLFSQNSSTVKPAQRNQQWQTMIAVDNSAEKICSRDIMQIGSNRAESTESMPRRGSTLEDKVTLDFRSTNLGRAWVRSGGRRRSLAGDDYRMQWLQRAAKAACIAAVTAQCAAFDAQCAASRAEHIRHRSMQPNMMAAALRATQELEIGEQYKPYHDHRQGVLLLREPHVEPTDPEALLLPVGLAELDIRRWCDENSSGAQFAEYTMSDDETSSSRPKVSNSKLGILQRRRTETPNERACVQPKRCGWGAWFSRVVLLQLDPKSQKRRSSLSPASTTATTKPDLSVDKWLATLAPRNAAQSPNSRKTYLQARISTPLQHIPPLPITVAARRQHLGWPSSPPMTPMLSHVVLLDFSNSATARIMRDKKCLQTSNCAAGQQHAAPLELVHSLCEALIDTSKPMLCTSTEPVQLLLPALKVIVLNEVPHFVHELTGRITPPLQRHTPAVLRAGVAAGFSSTVQSKSHAHGHRLSPCFASREAFSAALCAKSLSTPLASFPISGYFSVCAADALLIARMLRIAPARRCIMPPQNNVSEAVHNGASDAGPILGSHTKQLSIAAQNSAPDNNYSLPESTTYLPIDVIPPEVPVTDNGSASLPRPPLQPHFLLRGGVVAAAAAAPPERPDCIIVASGRRPRVDLTDGGRRTNAAIELMQCFAPRPVWLKKDVALVARSRRKSQIWSDGRAAWQQSYGPGAGESAQLAWSGICGQIWGGGGGGAMGSRTLCVLRALCSTVRGISHEGGIAAKQSDLSQSSVDASSRHSTSGAVPPDLALSWVSPLTSLDLRGNCIGPDGLLIIAHVLLGNDGKDSKAAVIKAAAVAAAEATAAAQVALSPDGQQWTQQQRQPLMWRYRCCPCRLRVLRLGYNEIVGISGKKTAGYNALVDALCKQPSSGTFVQTRTALASAQQWRALAASARAVTSSRSAQGRAALQQLSHVSKLRHQLELGATAGASAVEAAAAAAAAMAASIAAADAAGVGGNAVESLDLAANALNSSHLERLCSVLLLTHSLLRLDLSFNNLNCDAASTLAGALAERSVRLKVLNLRGNHLGGLLYPTENGDYRFISKVHGVIALLDQIKMNDSLTELDLGANALCGVLVAHPGDESRRDRDDIDRTHNNTDPEGWGGLDGGGVGHVHECASSASDSSDEDEEPEIAVGQADNEAPPRGGAAVRERSNARLSENSESDAENTVQSSDSMAASTRRAVQSARLAAMSMGPGGELVSDAFDWKPFEVLCSALRSNRRLVRIGLAANALAGYFDHPRTRRVMKCKMFPLAPLKAAVCFRAGLDAGANQLGSTLVPIEYIDLRGNDLQVRTAHVRRSVHKMQNAGCEVRL